MQMDSQHKASVLLIGTTGAGKSALGNYLLDPVGNEQPFKTAVDNFPTTQTVCSDSRDIKLDSEDGSKQLTLQVIDTPGINEGAIPDLRHMADLVVELRKADGISACIFVMKFNSKIDAQCKSTIAYYAKLLPALFEKNMFLVMTEYGEDDRSIAVRKRQGIDEQKMQENVVDAVVENACLSYKDPLLFTIDCLPVTADEIKASSDTRTSIINYIFSLVPIKLESLMVAKTDFLVQMDRGKIIELEGAIQGYKDTVGALNKTENELLRLIQSKEKEMADIQTNIDSKSNELKEKNTDELVDAVTWSVGKEWKWFQTQRNGYEIKSPWKVYNVRKWTNNRCTLEDTLIGNTLKGKVAGSFMRGLYATITLETKKNAKYENEINVLKKEIEEKKKEFASAKEKLAGLNGRVENCEKLVEQYKSYIEGKRIQIKQLSADKMSIDETIEKLKNLKLMFSVE